MTGDGVADDEVVGGAIQVSVIRAAGDTGNAVPAGVHPQVDIVLCLIAIVRRSDNVGAGAGAAVLVLDIQLKIVVEVAFSADDIEGGGAILNYQQSFGIGEVALKFLIQYTRPVQVVADGRVTVEAVAPLKISV